MSTRLGQFCDHFVTTVRPLVAPLDRCCAALAGMRSAASLSEELAELRQQVEGLCGKVAGQRSYVLIFGPLKSGKSTLMNAVAGSYVSEVSSLPAYPCLVFVGHGDQPSFAVTDYTGRSERFRDSAQLHRRIDAAHRDLAEHIRAAEGSGALFDPQEHFRTAIRRIDVEVPAKDLAKNGAVLVDTPGLYTRMRFGYDRMTRDFRNSAACAIFVVKSDTLFLEQVFSEFNQLLELFSRIFLVVNMDTTKRDVGPEGELVPSLEQVSPARILEAFADLAMPTPLKQAAEQGRVRIYAVDLLRAASSILSGRAVDDAGFTTFHRELNEYLSSFDYMVAFLRDSMQRALHLAGEGVELAHGEFRTLLVGEIGSVDAELAAARAELQLLQDASRLDWRPALARFDRELSTEVERASRDQGARIARDMSATLETWMLSSHSLEWMLATSWRPLVRGYVTAVRAAAARAFEQSVHQDHAGFELSEELTSLLATHGIDLRALRLAASAELHAEQGPLPEIPLDVDAIPVRRGVLDVLTFRNEGKVRDRLFGAPDQPDAKISARAKATRLGEPAKKYLNQFLLGFRSDFFKETEAAAQRSYSHDLLQRTVQMLLGQLASRQPALVKRVDEARAELDRLRGILTPLDDLHRIGEDVRQKVHALSRQFSATEADVLLAPARRAEPPAEGAGARRAQRRR